MRTTEDGGAPCIDAARGIRLAGQDEALYVEFLRQFPADDTLERLERALRSRDARAAYRHAHTLKGLCAQLGFCALERQAQALCCALRRQPPDIAAAEAALPALRDAHAATLCAIARLAPRA